MKIILLILGVLVTLVYFGLFIVKEENKKMNLIFACAGIVLIVLSQCFVIVKAGHTGVVVTMGAVEDTTLQEGMCFKLPFVQSVQTIDNRIVKLEVETEACSSDLQTITSTLAVNYRVDKQMSNSVFKNVGADYQDVLVQPIVNEVLKSTIAKYTAEQSITMRSDISVDLKADMNAKLNENGIIVEDVNIVNFSFSEAYNNAIEAKQVAEQELLTAKTQQEKVIVEANGEAEKVRIAAEAQAKANELLAQSLTDTTLRKMMIDKWNGTAPLYMGGDGSLSMLMQ